MGIENLYGLVLCGGLSSRMGVDKSMLVYYQKPQRFHVYDILTNCCSKVFLSLNNEQHSVAESNYLFLGDEPKYAAHGPMSGILTALDAFQQQNFLVTGCDYPFINREILTEFLSTLDPAKPAAFYNEQAAMYEPVLAYYPAGSFTQLKSMFDQQQYSLQQFLVMNSAVKFCPKDKMSMRSIDSPELLTEAKASLAINSV